MRAVSIRTTMSSEYEDPIGERNRKIIALKIVADVKYTTVWRVPSTMEQLAPYNKFDCAPDACQNRSNGIYAKGNLARCEQGGVYYQQSTHGRHYSSRRYEGCATAQHTLLPTYETI